MSAPSTRTVYRVLVDPVASSSLALGEHWFATAAEAFLFARAAEADDPGVEVNRVVLRPRLSRVELLQRARIVESSHVVPPEQWKRVLRRASRRGA